MKFFSPNTSPFSIKSNKYAGYFIIAVTVTSLCLILTVQKHNNKHELYTGQISPHDILAPFEFQYEDTASTELKRIQGQKNIPFVYKTDRKETKRILDTFDNIMSFLFHSTTASNTAPSASLLTLQINQKFNTELRSDLLKDTKPFTREEISEIKKLLKEILQRGVADSNVAQTLRSNEQKKIQLDGVLIDIDRLHIIGENDYQLLNWINYRIPLSSQENKQFYNHLLSRILSTTIYYDDLATKHLKTTKNTSIPPVMKTIKKGQIIIRRGEEVTRTKTEQIDALNKELAKRRGPGTPLRESAAIILIVMTALILTRYYLIHNLSKRHSNNYTVLFLAITSIGVVGLTKLISMIPVPEGLWLKYIFTLPLGTILVTVFFGPGMALFFSIIWTVLITTIYTAQTAILSIMLLSSIVFIFYTTKVTTRGTIVKSSFMAGMVTGLLIICFGHLAGISPMVILIHAGTGFGSCFVAGILSIGLLPLFEHMFSFCTNITLLELADLNHPLLRKLMIEAPGTYHHCLMVGNIAEAGAECINANSILSKVGAYFHDIGKIIKPHYFNENVWMDKSIHDDLEPSMSNLIIISHVKDGIDLARKHHLPEVIIDIIKEHHGTSLVYYFYKRAQTIAKDKNQTIEEKQFRYPGPKPQTKESGIIMLADSVEAASRSLDSPTPARIGSLVREIINQKYVDGQLDDCAISLRELTMIADRFTRILNATFHSRIKYPEQDNNEQDKEKKIFSDDNGAQQGPKNQNK